MSSSFLFRFQYPPPPSVFVTAMSMVSLVSLANAGLSEIRGRHLQYSKFWDVRAPNTLKVKRVKVSSRAGMLALYAPAFLAGLVSFWLFPGDGLRFMLLSSALTLHFLKRVVEVLFIHKYSGAMILDSVVAISLSYFLSAVTMIYNQHLVDGVQEPPFDLKYIGFILFMVSSAANFYHHYLLAKLREKDDKGYKIPKGGMFNLVICPHYLFEILAFVGVSFISQTVYPFCFTIGTTFYLLGRSYCTRKWYLSKFENFPKDVKALVPYIF
ncbi:hypothetical protein Scep_021949 [Stephania cephalantha]|uniref:3-oxo-5-alpha-steroid 4-dehydrogenase C-terminal domain-containing protein n=1 Tax=Stephania cephalantha TaxID=152367 RepID=A0AAP0I1V5_9MAGN